jgi:hypothetical protein
MDRHQRMREEFRHYYYTRHGIRLDDEVLIILIRMAHMHRDIRRELRRSPPLQFKNRGDYFFYGMGRVTAVILPLMLLCIMFLLLKRMI